MLALHAPDGFLEPSTAIATAVLSAAILAVAIRRSAAALEERQLPLAGIAAAFIFAAQMVNFPVASGTTGHLLGGALAAILLGPATGAVVVTVVVVVQALLFADGGLSALGYNTLNMAIIPAIGGYGLYLFFRRLLPADRGGVVGATGLAAGLSVVLSAIAFSIEWLFGASAPVAFDDVFTAMVGVHLFIGIGEGIITAMVVAAVLGTRPDLVAGADDLGRAVLAERTPVSLRAFGLGAVLTAVLLATVVSQFAADGPDGLERISIDEGIESNLDEAAEPDEQALGTTVFADYATEGIDNRPLSLAVAGLTGTLATLAVGYGVLRAARPGRAGSA